MSIPLDNTAKKRFYHSCLNADGYDKKQFEHLLEPQFNRCKPIELHFGYL